MASSSVGGSSRENTAKSVVSDQISQAVLSTSNLLHLMQQSSPSQVSSYSLFLILSFSISTCMEASVIKWVFFFFFNLISDEFDNWAFIRFGKSECIAENLFLYMLMQMLMRI